MRTLSKICKYGFSALLGIVAGVMLYSCLMIVEVETAYMLPSLEPGDKVLVVKNNSFTREHEIHLKPEKGDVVIYEAPVFSVDGEGSLLIRRVTGQGSEMLYVDSDVKTTLSKQDSLEEGEVLGKVIFNLTQMDKI